MPKFHTLFSQNQKNQNGQEQKEKESDDQINGCDMTTAADKHTGICPFNLLCECGNHQEVTQRHCQNGVLIADKIKAKNACNKQRETFEPK